MSLKNVPMGIAICHCRPCICQYMQACFLVLLCAVLLGGGPLHPPIPLDGVLALSIFLLLHCRLQWHRYLQCHVSTATMANCGAIMAPLGRDLARRLQAPIIAAHSTVMHCHLRIPCHLRISYSIGLGEWSFHYIMQGWQYAVHAL